MARVLRHRQTKGAATDSPNQPPRPRLYRVESIELRVKRDPKPSLEVAQSGRWNFANQTENLYERWPIEQRRISRLLPLELPFEVAFAVALERVLAIVRNVRSVGCKRRNLTTPVVIVTSCSQLMVGGVDLHKLGHDLVALAPNTISLTPESPGFVHSACHVAVPSSMALMSSALPAAA